MYLCELCKPCTDSRLRSKSRGESLLHGPVSDLLTELSPFQRHLLGTHCQLTFTIVVVKQHLRNISRLSCFIYLLLSISIFYPPFASRAKGEVFGLLYVCLFVRQQYLDNPWADSRQSSHAGVLWFRMCLPFWGLTAHGGLKEEMKFSLLWESTGNFCILAVFERYLSNACTDPH